MKENKKAYVYPRAGKLVVEDGVVKVRWETPTKKYERYFSSPYNYTTYVTHKGVAHLDEE